jgi:hypothetical protein
MIEEYEKRKKDIKNKLNEEINNFWNNIKNN